MKDQLKFTRHFDRNKQRGRKKRSMCFERETKQEKIKQKVNDDINRGLTIEMIVFEYVIESDQSV